MDRPGGISAIGGTPVVRLAQLVLPVKDTNQVAARLRQGRPPVFCRVEEGAVVFDLRTVPAEDDDRLVRAIRYALQQS